MKQLTLNVINHPDEYNGTKRLEIKERFIIGRADNCYLTLPDLNRFISSRHCEVSYYGDIYYLTDISTNGTFVNGERTPKNQPLALHASDVISIGSYELQVVIEEQVTQVDIALDIAPERDSLDPLHNLESFSIEEKEDENNTVEDLFDDTRSSEPKNTVDPIDLLHHDDKGDNHLLDDDEPEPTVTVEHAGASTFDDSYSVHNSFIPASFYQETEQPVEPLIPETHEIKAYQVEPASDIPSSNSIPKKWDAQHQTIPPEFDLVDTQQDSVSEVAYKQVAVNAVDIQQEILNINSVAYESKSISKFNELDQKNDKLTQEQIQSVVELEPKHCGFDRHFDAFMDGLGMQSNTVQVDEKLCYQLGHSFKILLSQMQLELENIEYLKSDHVPESEDVLSLLLSLYQQKLLDPSELMQQITDELKEHRVLYEQASFQAFCQEQSNYAPDKVIDSIAGRKKLYFKKDLWNHYQEYYSRQRRRVNDLTGDYVKSKVKQQYQHLLREKNA